MRIRKLQFLQLIVYCATPPLPSIHPLPLRRPTTAAHPSSRLLVVRPAAALPLLSSPLADAHFTPTPAPSSHPGLLPLIFLGSCCSSPLPCCSSAFPSRVFSSGSSPRCPLHKDYVLGLFFFFGFVLLSFSVCISLFLRTI
ncbi:hypothetical protein O6H91_13G026800 [Diphasiastrum complanatum]|uniref:Uncharacterized protein n=1 Tax=Diphasiastrum complanatum TaxID=34168 RepID=A0ACC2BT41_DIPCM|nr:hypothetical protein O6H91_13G026800 [Diphasiastrum complanatum]